MDNGGSTIVRLPGADGVRGLACLVVLVTHAVSMFFPASAPYLAGTGKIGVWLFFVLSAFLLSYKFRQTGFGSWVVLEYAVGRTLRIIPLFIVAVVFYRFFGSAGIDSWDLAHDAILFEKGFVHLWTVPVEFKFYFILPLFAFVVVKARAWLGSKGVLALFVVTVVLHQVIWPFWGTEINSTQLRWYLPCFLVGVLLGGGV